MHCYVWPMVLSLCIMTTRDTHRVVLMLTTEEHGKLRAMAAKDERTLSAQVRILIREAFAERARANGRPVPEH